MNMLNGWQRLWVSVTIIYLGVVLVGAYIKQPTNDDVQQTEILAFISTGTLRLMAATGQDVEWREAVKDGISISIPPQLDATLAKAYTAEYLDAHRMALRDKRVGFLAVAFAYWTLPSLLLLVIGFLTAWVRRGFSARAP